jgi:hypothetical protein
MVLGGAANDLLVICGLDFLSRHGCGAPLRRMFTVMPENPHRFPGIGSPFNPCNNRTAPHGQLMPPHCRFSASEVYAVPKPHAARNSMASAFTARFHVKDDIIMKETTQTPCNCRSPKYLPSWDPGCSRLSRESSPPRRKAPADASLYLNAKIRQARKHLF